MKVDFSTMEESENKESLYINTLGHYDLRVNKIEEKVNSNNKEYLLIEFRNDKGQILNESFYLTPRALFRLKRLAESCLNKEISITDDEFDTAMLLDKWVQCDLQYGTTYTNKDDKEITPVEIDIFTMTVSDKSDEDKQIENLKQKVGKDGLTYDDPF